MGPRIRAGLHHPGTLKNLSIRWRNSDVRRDVGQDLHENRLIINYPLSICKTGGRVSNRSPCAHSLVQRAACVFSTAWMIIFATSPGRGCLRHVAGCDLGGLCADLLVVTLHLQLLIIRSSLATKYQGRYCVQAATLNLRSSKAAARIRIWVAVMIAVCSAGRSCAKSVAMPCGDGYESYSCRLQSGSKLGARPALLAGEFGVDNAPVSRYRSSIQGPAKNGRAAPMWSDDAVALEDAMLALVMVGDAGMGQPIDQSRRTTARLAQWLVQAGGGDQAQIDAARQVALLRWSAVRPSIWLRIPRSSGHPFHEHLTTDSTVIRPPIPRIRPLIPRPSGRADRVGSYAGFLHYHRPLFRSRGCRGAFIHA